MRRPGVSNVEPHRLVLDAAPARPDADLEPAVGQQVEGRDLLRQHGGDVVVDAEDAAAERSVRGVRRRRGDRRDRSEVLARGVRGPLRGARPEVVVGEEERRVAEILYLGRRIRAIVTRSEALVAWIAKRKGCLSTLVSVLGIPALSIRFCIFICGC